MADMSDVTTVWVFNGATARFPSAVFSNKESATLWIKQHGLSGVLTRYPVDQSVYDWATERGHFVPSKEVHRTGEFIGKFTTGSQEHYHFEEGIEGG